MNELERAARVARIKAKWKEHGIRSDDEPSEREIAAEPFERIFHDFYWEIHDAESRASEALDLEGLAEVEKHMDKARELLGELKRGLSPRGSDEALHDPSAWRERLG